VLRKVIRNTLKVLKCGAGEGWRSVGPIVWKMNLHGVKEGRHNLHTVKRRKGHWIGRILRRNCLLKHIIEGSIEGKTEGTGRRGRICKQTLDDLTETRRCWKLKEEALALSVGN
jgi:hypothetical protein